MSDKATLPKVRYATLVGLLLGVLGIGFWATFNLAGAVADEATEGTSDSVMVRVDQGTQTFVCPPGVIDPQDLSVTSNGSEFPTIAGANVMTLDGGGVALEIETPEIVDGAESPFSVAGVGSGDLASYLLARCELPTRHGVLPAGSTKVGEDTVLILSNPAVKPVTASIQILSSIGPVLDTNLEVLVPAHTTVSLLPAIWAPSESRIAVVVESDGQGVVAWLQSSGLKGEVPAGLGRLAAQSPANLVSIVGVDASEDNILRVANMGTSPSEATVLVLTASGTKPLAGVERLFVEAHGVFDLALGNLPSGTYGLVVEAEQPIVAAVTAVSEGNPFPDDEDLNVTLRSLVGKADPVESITVPSVAALSQATEALGFELLSAEVVVSNIEQNVVTLEVGGQRILLDPGASYTTALPSAGALTVRTDEGRTVRGALIVEAEAESGTFRSVTPLEEDAMVAVVREVRILPTH